MEKEKVFCENCRWFAEAGDECAREWMYLDTCWSPKRIRKTSKRHFNASDLSPANPAVVNKKHNCKWYESSWSYLQKLECQKCLADNNLTECDNHCKPPATKKRSIDICDILPWLIIPLGIAGIGIMSIALYVSLQS